jgi:hypothetical protein
LNWHPCVAEHEAFVLEYLQRVPQVPVLALYWQTSGFAEHADRVVRFTQAVTQVPETGLIWQRDPAPVQPAEFVPNASKHDCAQLPSTHWQELRDPQVVDDAAEQSVLHWPVVWFHAHSGLLSQALELPLYIVEHDFWQVLLANWQAPLAPHRSRLVVILHDVPHRPLSASQMHSTSPSQLPIVA